jgi:hypothetical protein
VKAGTDLAGCILEQMVAFYECVEFLEGIAYTVRLIIDL